MKMLSEKFKKGSALAIAGTFLFTLSLGACSAKKTEEGAEEKEGTEVVVEPAVEETHEGHDHAAEHPSSDSTATEGGEHPTADSTATEAEHPGM